MSLRFHFPVLAWLVAIIVIAGDALGGVAGAAPAATQKNESSGTARAETVDVADKTPPKKGKGDVADDKATAPTDDTPPMVAENEAAKPTDGKPEQPAPAEPEAKTEPEADELVVGDPAAMEDAEAAKAAATGPADPDPVQIFGWREIVSVSGVEGKFQAKLDTGAQTSSIHATEKELFERDGKKWVRFVVTDPRVKDSPRTRIEAPLVRVARIKEPGGESIPREVVRLSIRIGERKLRAEFTLSNRHNMNCPVLIGRTTLKDLGVVDPGRTYLADQKIIR